MKRKLIRSLATAAACLLVCSSAQAKVELLAATVGKGDALLVRAGNYTCLIDTGKSDAEKNLDRVLSHLKIDALDAVFITHTDKDHTGGLKWLRKSDIEIRAIYASRYYPETTTKKHQAVKTAEKLGLEVNWLGAGDRVPLGDSGAVFEVVAPEREIPGNEDDNSLVMMLNSPDGRILFAGDMERQEEKSLLSSGADLHCDVLKVPNHGDSDACSADLISACAPKIAVISTDTDEKPDTPDSRVLKNLKKAGCATFITQDCTMGVYVTLDAGEVQAKYVNW
ncbi:MAG: MBL fold metallo-hydrolase [Clostridia bacterium]|nr:MBL fold metallo-hydrolase [Clostridia bacterium]MBP3653714.1 MBL fold metallo-hydrolase [Clostridia bacterium]